jgi:uncharacterized repeat protein (TIGR01451 family)
VPGRSTSAPSERTTQGERPTQSKSIVGSLGACLSCALAVLAFPALAEAATVNLDVDQTDSPDPLLSREVLTYTIVVSNRGPDPARSVRLLDRLPRRINFLGASSSQASCGRKSRRRVVCRVHGPLANNAAATITIQVRPIRADKPYQMTNFVSVGRRKSDPNRANNVERERTRVENPPPVICAGRRATVIGTVGNDRLVGTKGRDVIAASSGDDDVLALGGNDIVCGSGGRDAIRGGGGGDLIQGGGGPDDLAGGDESDLLVGRSDRDHLHGGRGNDVLRGGHGSDRCFGGSGADSRRSC